jgi:hypothetical protein
VFHDSSDVPVVIEKTERVADFYVFRLGGEVVHQQIVRAFHVLAGKKDESARNGVEAVAVYTVNEINSAGRAELQKNGRDGLNVFQFS